MIHFQCLSTLQITSTQIYQDIKVLMEKIALVVEFGRVALFSMMELGDVWFGLFRLILPWKTEKILIKYDCWAVCWYEILELYVFILLFGSYVQIFQYNEFWDVLIFNRYWVFKTGYCGGTTWLACKSKFPNWSSSLFGLCKSRNELNLSKKLKDLSASLLSMHNVLTQSLVK